MSSTDTNQASEDEQIDDVLTNAIDYYISGKPMTNYNERLDKALNWQQRMIVFEALNQGISDTHKLEITDDIMNKYRDEAKQAILRWVADEVIGENETGIITNPDSVDYGEHYSNVYVDREEQRKILAQHGYKGANQ